MQLSPALDFATFMTPLPRARLLEPGVDFPRHELRRRVLSGFWQDCCMPLQFSRAPAPAIELADEPGLSHEPRPVRAWWLLEDGILEETEGPASDRLQPYLGGADVFRLWPRYEFRISNEPLTVTMSLHQDALTVRHLLARLAMQPGDRLRVETREYL